MILAIPGHLLYYFFFYLTCKLSPCMKGQSLFFGGEKEKNIINMSYAEFAQGVVMVKTGNNALSRCPLCL